METPKRCRLVFVIHPKRSFQMPFEYVQRLSVSAYSLTRWWWHFIKIIQIYKGLTWFCQNTNAQWRICSIDHRLWMTLLSSTLLLSNAVDQPSVWTQVLYARPMPRGEVETKKRIKYWWKWKSRRLTVNINLIDHVSQLAGWRVHTERLHHRAELVRCDLTISVDVE